MSEESKIFIAGPPGVRKSELTERAGEALGLEVEDLSGGETSGEIGGPSAWEDALDGGADVVVMSWTLTEDAGAMRAARERGTVIGLWDHPLNLNERAEDPISYEPTRSMKTRGGFGRTGKATNEYRRMKRKSDDVLDLVDMGREEAADFLEEVLEYYLDRREQTPIERMRLSSWPQDLVDHQGADPEAAERAVRAIAAFMMHAEEEGASDRKMRAVRSDLQAAAQLVFDYDAPDAEGVLGRFSRPTWVRNFRRKYARSERLVDRYERHARDFAEFLESYEAGE